MADTEEEAIHIGAVHSSEHLLIFGGSIIRALLVAMGSRHLLVITIHHIACDGVSVALIMAELRDLYLNALQPGAIQSR